MRIAVDPDALMREANQMDHVGEALAGYLKGVDSALALPGLPGYLGETRAAARDVRAHVADLHAAAALLRTRALLAKLAGAPGMGSLKLKLEQYERHSLSGFQGALGDALKSFVVDQATKRSVVLSDTLAESFKALQLTPDELKRMRNHLKLDMRAFYKQYKTTTKLNVRFMVNVAQPANKAGEAGARAFSRFAGGGPLEKIKSGPFQIALDLYLQFQSDRDQRFKHAYDKPARMAINAGVGAGTGFLAAEGAALLSCPESIGAGCAAGVAIAAGTVANLVVTPIINKHAFPTDSDRELKQRLAKMRQQALQARKLEQWYLENGRPTEGFLKDRIAGILPDTPNLDVKIYYREGQQIAIVDKRPDGTIRERFYDNHGKLIER